MYSRTFLISLLFFVPSSWSSTTFTNAQEGVNLDESKYPQQPMKVKIKALPFFFEQSFLKPVPSHYDFVARNFGVVGAGKDGEAENDEAISSNWGSFKEKIENMNRYAEEGVSYKVLYLARHGEGQHNAAEKWYGPEGWECYWAMQPGNGTYTWAPDSKLTEKGISQVKTTNLAWKRQISLGAPLPEAHYVSSLSRALSTIGITWEDIALDPPRPIVKELLRETLSLHLGDKRSPKTTLQSVYPYISFDPNYFPEHDQLWTYHRESLALRDLRIKTVLTEILGKEESTYIAITCHSGAIQSALRILGHQEWPVNTAGMIPVVVEIKEKENEDGEMSYWDVIKKMEKKEPEWRSVCENFPEIFVAGDYVVPGGVGRDELLPLQ